MTILFLMAATVGQMERAEISSVPDPDEDDVPTFIMKRRNDPADYPVGIKINNEWLRDRAGPASNVKQIEVVYDTPWHPQPSEKILYSRIERLTYEALALRRARLARGWENAGYTFVDTPQGRIPVLKRELELARIAQEMANKVDRELYPPEEVVEEAAPASDPGGASRIVRAWWPHVVILVIGLSLAGLVIKRMVLPGGTAGS